MGNPMDVLAPNYMGDAVQNAGVEVIVGNSGVQAQTANYGQGVAELQGKKSNPQMEKLRRHKAREFGLTKETVGF